MNEIQNGVKNKKGDTVKVVLIIVLLILLIASMSFTVYDKFIKKENSNPMVTDKDKNNEDNIKNDSQIENKDDLIVNGEKYELIDINADVDFDSYKVVLNNCLGCGSWTFIFNTETTAKCNDQDIKFPKSIKYWSSTIINNNNVAYFLLSGEGDLYTFNATTKEINLILSNTNITAIANTTDEDGTEITVLKTTSGNKKIVLK